MISKRALAELIKEKGIVILEKPIRLSSGGSSHYYYDIKHALLTAKGLNLVADLGITYVMQFNAESIGGLESGSIPIATAISYRSNKTSNPISSFFVRKKAREHGLQKWIEGDIKSPVLIVEDVTTTGKSALSALEKVQEIGFKVAGIITIIDREQGAALLFRNKGIKFEPMFTHSFFKSHIEERIESIKNTGDKVQYKS